MGVLQRVKSRNAEQAIGTAQLFCNLSAVRGNGPENMYFSSLQHHLPRRKTRSDAASPENNVSKREKVQVNSSFAPQTVPYLVCERSVQPRRQGVEAHL